MSTPAPARAQRVLVVDDCPDTRDSLCRLLRLWGHEARGAPDGPTALKEARVFRPDVVLLDLVLPGADGCAVAQGLRRLPGLGSVALWAFTGHGLPQDIDRARAAGFDAHLLKPFAPDRLRLLLRDHCPRG